MSHEENIFSNVEAGFGGGFGAVGGLEQGSTTELVLKAQVLDVVFSIIVDLLAGEPIVRCQGVDAVFL